MLHSRGFWLGSALLSASACVASGCSGDRGESDAGRTSDAARVGGDAAAAAMPDFANAARDADVAVPAVDAGEAGGGDAGLTGGDGGACARELCGDGRDDDCDDSADEGCACDGDARSCFPGPPEAAGVGSCQTGTQSCEGADEFAVWGACVGFSLPGLEVCDGELDEDCDGAVDEGLGDCCTPGEMRECPLEEGMCVPGVQHCNTRREWSDCRGGVPAGEVADLCNGRDDDCDAQVDEDFVPTATPGVVLDGALYEAHWYAGDFVVDWRVDPPAVACPAAGNAFEGSSTWSDPQTGELLYYTNGLTLWDAAGNLVPNGEALAGNMTATETSFFAPVPGSGLGELMVFVNDTSSVYYSILDVAGGMVDPASVNTLVASGTGEAIGGVDDLAGGFWLVLFGGDTLDSYHVTSRAIGALPDVQSPLPITVDAASRGTIRFSRDRTRVAIATETPAGVYWAPFDATSGAVTGAWTQVSALSGYSVDFSPNGQMIYFAASVGVLGWQSTELWQFDTVGGSGMVIANGDFSGVALAPDGDLYAHAYNATALGRLDDPDVGGSAAWTADALDLAGCRVSFNLSKQLFLPSVVGCTEQSCDDGNPCTADVCDEESGVCSHACTEC